MINEETFFRLDEILAIHGGEQSMVESSEVHGLVTALVCSGQEISEARFHQLIWEEDSIDWETDEDQEDFIKILGEIRAEIEAGLSGGKEFHPLFAEFDNEDGENMVDVEVWCEGFCIAIDEQPEAWKPLLDVKHKGLNIITLFGTEEGHGVLDITPDEEIEQFAKAIAPATMQVYQALRAES